MYNDKIFYSHEPTVEQEVLLLTFLKEKGYYDLLRDNHMYISISDRPDEVYFKIYKSSRVRHIMNTHGLSEIDTIEYLFTSFEFYQELRELMYWNSIGDYKKFVPCTGEITTVKGTESVVENECVFAKTATEAEILFRDIGYTDLMYVVDLDE